MSEEKTVLNVDELEEVNGGRIAARSRTTSTGTDTVERYCPNCKANRVFELHSGGRAYCKECRHKIEI